MVASAAMSAVAKLVLALLVALLTAIAFVLPGAALAKTPKRSPSCESSSRSVSSPAGGELVPAELSGQLEAGVLTEFGVLRRAALPSDQLPTLSPAGFELDSQLASYYPGYVRQVKTLANGGRYFVIPGFARQQRIPPASCLPVALQRERPQLVERERKLASEPAYCIIEIGAENPGSECELFAAVEQSPRVFAPTLSEEAIVELVPDGVASVRVTYAYGAPVVAPTAENVYTVPAHGLRSSVQRRLKKLARREEHDKHATRAEQKHMAEVFLQELEKAVAEAAPRKLEWLNSAGEVVRSIAPPSASSYLTDTIPVNLEG